MANNLDLRAFLLSSRPPVELAEYGTTYRRTRVAVNVLIGVMTVAMNHRFDYRLYIVLGIAVCNTLIVGHTYIRRRAGLLEMVSWDTALYLTMTMLVDLPEVAIFVAMAQSFIVFFFVPARTAVVTTSIFTMAGTLAAAVSLVSDVQQRSQTESVFIVTVVTVVTMIPASWTLLRAGAEMHRHRDQEEKLAKEKDDLLVDKDRFVASVSHELRTPLTTVVGLAHTLAESPSSLTAKEHAEFLGTLVEQSEEVAAIVDDLLVAARAETGHLSMVLQEVDLAEELAAVVPADTAVVINTRGPLLVDADPVRVRQVLRNLVSNCDKYGGPNRRVRLSTQGINSIVSIEDDGPPIPQSQLDLIFTAYGRAHDSPGRTDSVGLGLTVSRQLARLMGGDVVYRHVDGWSSFALALPTAITSATKAIYSDPATARLAHRPGVR